VTTATYGSSPTKQRRSSLQIQTIRNALYDVLAADNPATVRGVFYQMVGRGVIVKAESEYKRTVCRLLAQMRLSGDIPFGWLADNTRWMRKPTTYSSLESALRITAETYRRSVWDLQSAYVEVWLEKDALAGVLLQVTSPWDVPLMVTRVYPSLSYLYEAAETISRVEKPVYIYYLGDYDPSGVDIPRNVEARLREFAPAAEIHFERIAVTQQQIRDLNLPTRPTKTKDSRAGQFDGESVEVDAIPARVLRDLVDRNIRQHVSQSSLQVLGLAEESERDLLRRIAKNVALVGPGTD
jgi:hypothetical protein